MDDILKFDLNLISIIWGLLGSMSLIKDVIVISTKDIVNTAGTIYSFKFENLAIPLIKRRFDTIYGGVLLFLSYLFQLINTTFIKQARITDDALSIWGALLIGLVLYFLKGRYQERVIKKVTSERQK